MRPSYKAIKKLRSDPHQKSFLSYSFDTFLVAWSGDPHDNGKEEGRRKEEEERERESRADMRKT